MTSSDSAVKSSHAALAVLFPDFFYHQYGICRMYSKENPQYFRLLFRAFILRASNVAFECRSFLQAVALWRVRF